MAISLVATPQTANANNGGNATITWSTRPSEGDYTVVVIGSPATSGNIGKMVTTGYTELASHAGANNTKPSLAIFYKKQGATTDTTAVGASNNSNATDSSLIGFVLRGVDPTTFSDATPTTAGETSSTNPDPASITVGTSGAAVIVAAVMVVRKDSAITAPSGYTGYSVVGDDTDDHTLAAAYKLNCSGTESPASWTNWGTGLWYAITIAVKPASESVQESSDRLVYSKGKTTGSSDRLLYIEGANTPPTVALGTNVVDAATITDTTPSFEFTGTDAGGDDIRYNIQIDTVNTFDSQKSLTEFTVADSYSSENINAWVGIYSGSVTGYAQSFTGNGGAVDRVVLFLYRVSGTGPDLSVEIYAHSGTYGVDGVPTGAALATSDSVSWAEIPAYSERYEGATFEFQSPVTTTSGEKYFIVFRNTSGSEVDLGLDTSSPTHTGNACYYLSGWTSQSSQDSPFIVQSAALTPLLDHTSNVETAAFVRTADSDPFTSGQEVTYTVPEANALPAGDTYYWRVRGLDPSGSNTYGAWSSTRSFTISSGTAASSDRGLYSKAKATSSSDRGLYTRGKLIISEDVVSVCDSYSESNHDSNLGLDGGYLELGQSFEGDGRVLSSVKFYLMKTGSPTGNAVAKIYTHTGTYGTSSLPTGSALATSDTFDVSTLGTSHALTEFTFSGTNKITLEYGTHYIVTIDYLGDSANKVLVGIGPSSSTHLGNAVYRYSGGWAAASSMDFCFYVYTTTVISRLLYTKGGLLGSSDRLLYSKGKVVSSSDRLLYSRGKLTNSSDRLLYTKGGLIGSSDRLLYSKGTSSGSSDRGLYIKAKATDSSDKLLYTKSSASGSSDRLIYSEGSLISSSDRLLYSEGSVNASSGRGLFSKGIASSDSDRLVYTKGIATSSSDRLLNTTGKLTGSSDRLIYTEGNIPSVEASSERLLYSKGKDTGSSDRLLYSKGVSTGSSDRTLYTSGSLADSSDRLLYSKGGLTSDSDRLLYSKGSIAQSSDRLLYTKGVNTDSSERNIYTKSTLGGESDRLLYSNGVSTSSSDRLLYTKGSIASSSERLLHSKGITTNSGERLIYSQGSIASSSDRQLYSKGIDAIIATITVASDASQVVKEMVKSTEWREGTSGSWLTTDCTLNPSTTYQFRTPLSGMSSNSTAILPNIKASVTVDWDTTATSISTLGNYFMYYYAYNCSSLTSLDVPDTSGLTSVGDDFMGFYAQDCSSLTSLSVPDTSGLTSVGGYFMYYYASGCSSLTSLSAPDTSGLTSVGDGFMYYYAYRCSSLTSLSVPDTSGLTSVGDDFMSSYAEGCSGLTSLSVPDTSGLTSVGGYFMYCYAYNCSSLTSLDVPDTSGITSVGSSFMRFYAESCTSLISLILPAVGWFATHDVNWSVPSGRLGYLKGYANNVTDRDNWRALTTSTSPNTLYINYIRSADDVTLPPEPGDSNRLIYTTGSVLGSSDRGLYTKGVSTSSSERLLYSIGGLQESSERNVLTKGVDTSSSDRLLYSEGSIASSLERLLHSKGINTGSSDRLLYTEGSISDTSDRLVYSKGIATSSGERLVYSKGSILASSERQLYSKGISTSSSDRLIHTIGSLSDTSEKLLYSKGVDTSSSDRNIHSVGGGITSSDRILYSKGKILQSSDRLIYSEGKIPEGQAESDRLIYTKGVSTSSSERNLHSIGGGVVSSGRLLYTSSEATSDSARGLFTKGVASSSSDRLLYEKGVASSSSDRLIYTEGIDTENESTRGLYSKGVASSSSERNIYSEGGLTNSSDRLVYSKGKTVGSSDRGLYSKSGTVTAKFKRWNGSEWVSVTLKRYNGATWDTEIIKRYNGATWEDRA